jgi:hypothetical protein
MSMNIKEITYIVIPTFPEGDKISWRSIKETSRPSMIAEQRKGETLGMTAGLRTFFPAKKWHQRRIIRHEVHSQVPTSQEFNFFHFKKVKFFN